LREYLTRGGFGDTEERRGHGLHSKKKKIKFLPAARPLDAMLDFVAFPRITALKPRHDRRGILVVNETARDDGRAANNKETQHGESLSSKRRKLCEFRGYYIPSYGI